MANLSDHALLLRRTPFGESSLVVQACTRSHGRVHLIAKGAFRPTSRYYAALDWFDTLELEWSPARLGELGTLRAGSIGRRRATLPWEPESYRAAHAVLEQIELASRHEHVDTALFDAAEHTLERLELGVPNETLELARFELEFLDTLGLTPALVACAACGNEAPPTAAQGARVAFSAGAGGRLCRRCADEARASGRRVGTLPLAVLADAEQLSRTGALEQAAAVGSEGRSARIDALREFVARFVDYQLEMQPRAHRRFLAGRLGALMLCFVLFSACSSTPHKLAASKVEEAIASAQQDLAEGRTESALRWMRSAALTENLPTAQRERVQALLERAAQKRIEELSTKDSDPDALADLVPLGLPRQLAVEAGMRAARRWHERGDEMKAFRELKQLDTKYPQHHEHLAAGDLMIAIGEAQSKKHKRFLFFYNTDDDAREVLEYALLNHPSAAHCDEGYETLADLYERDDSLSLAIDRLEKLVLYHNESPLRPSAQARIPHLRLLLLHSPEYDRGTLLKAERELKEWLRTFEESQAELAAQVQIELGDCLRRLCENDLVIADFYKTVSNAFGARYHAERAVSEAREAGDPERTERAEKALAALPPADTTAARSREAKDATP